MSSLRQFWGECLVTLAEEKATEVEATRKTTLLENA